MTSKMYFLVRSDPDGWGLPEIVKMASKCLPIALDDVENVFLVRSDPGDGWGLPEFVKNGFQMHPNSLR